MAQLERQRKGEYPARFTPRGLVDAFDATDKFQGACIALKNLIFDQSNPEVMVSRPGVSSIYAFGDFTTPGVVSVHVTVGNVTYGMISSARNAGKDEPFAYDHVAGAFIAVAGVTNGNSPTTQATTGAWTPPTMASVGVYIIVTHPGFPGGATKFGYFDITVPGAPVWAAGDTATNALSSTPLWVANFGNRAWFGCTNAALYTDVLTLTRTSSTQVLTIGDSSNCLAAAGLPVQTTSSGVVQALIIFKAFQVWQVTGDAATVGGSDLKLNYLSLAVGSSSPRSIVQAPSGLYFASIGGPKIITPLGVVRDVTHDGGQQEQDATPDIQAPFQNAVVPSRIAAGYSGNIYRVCMETVVRGVQSFNDYWFNENRRRWTGPHSFSFDCASQFGNYFVIVSNANPAKLYKSESLPSSNSVYTDDGTAITALLQSSTFPKTGHMAMKQVVQSTQELASAGGAASYQITALDDLGNTLNSCQISILPSGALWNAAVWGAFTWASNLNIPTPYNVPWSAPLVFKKLALYITASASTALALGTHYAMFRELGIPNNK